MIARSIVLAVALAAAAQTAALAQSATVEFDVTVGQSSENVRAVATQARVFGDAIAGWRYYGEASWGDQWGVTSDAFGGSYPYDKRIRPIELYAEKTVLAGRYIAGVRVGRYRAPFGMSSRTDHAYGGFLRAPLIRYGNYWALSNNFLEGGASVMAGTPKLFAEASLGIPQDVDVQARRRGLDGILRGQATMGSFIVGASYIRTRPSTARTFATGSTEFSGIDVRWMAGGVELRGEWIDGRPFDGAHTAGGYVDAIIHRPAMRRVTAVLRAERLDYDAGRFSAYPRRYTVGARMRLSRALTGQFNLVRQPGGARVLPISAVDVALTLNTRR